MKLKERQTWSSTIPQMIHHHRDSRFLRPACISLTKCNRLNRKSKGDSSRRENIQVKLCLRKSAVFFSNARTVLTMYMYICLKMWEFYTLYNCFVFYVRPFVHQTVLSRLWKCWETNWNTFKVKYVWQVSDRLIEECLNRAYSPLLFFSKWQFVCQWILTRVRSCIWECGSATFKKRSAEEWLNYVPLSFQNSSLFHQPRTRHIHKVGYLNAV